MNIQGDAAFVDRTPVAIAELDQVKARMIDVLRGTNRSILLADVQTETGSTYALLSACDGVVHDTKQFFLASLIETFMFVQEATKASTVELCLMLCQAVAAEQAESEES